MRKIIMIIILSIQVLRAGAQEQEAQQLLLNVEKLAQLKKILNNMYQGYRTLSQGYNKVRDIATGNFSLHQIFLGGLLQVSPAVRNYYKVAEIIRMQAKIVSGYKAAFASMKTLNVFSSAEINYAGKVYGQLFDETVSSLDELLMILTASKLRMSDEERLAAIDKIFDDVGDQFQFLRQFNSETKMLALQRRKELSDVNASRTINNVK